MKLELTPGALVAGRYRLDRLLGEGGMGSVWAATHTVTRRSMALKFLRGPAHTRVEMRKRFLREARAAVAVDHPNVVTVHDVFELDDETPVMVMDLLVGETFGQRLKREQTLSLSDAAAILVPVVSAVGAAHAKGIVHRDLKPENVFLVRAGDGDPVVKVLDFGIAKLVSTGPGEQTADITGTGTMLGTPVYMAPEQGFGEKDVDHRVDIWAIGVMLYEALSGGRPVEGENLGQVLKRMMSDGITPLEAVVPDVPSDVADLVRRMLARDREDRPADLREVADVLARHTAVVAATFSGARSSNAALDDAPSLGETVDAHAATEQMSIDTEGAHSLPIGSSKRRRRAAGLAVAGVAIAALVAWRWTSEPASEAGARSAAAASPPPRSDPVTESEPRSVAPAPMPLPEPAAGASAESPSPTRSLPAKGSARRGAEARVSVAVPSSPLPPAAVPPLPAKAAPAKTPRSGGLVDDPPF